MAAAKWYTCHDDVKELAATAPFLELGASMFLAGRAVSDLVCAGAKRPKPRRREADLLMDSFAEGLSDGRPRGRGQRRQPQEKALCAAAPSRPGHTASQV